MKNSVMILSFKSTSKHGLLDLRIRADICYEKEGNQKAQSPNPTDLSVYYSLRYSPDIPLNGIFF